MGWTSFNLNQPVKQWFNEKYNNEHHEVIDVAIVKRTRLYAAVKDKKTNDVFALIFLLRWQPKSDMNFSYKDMDETVGPYYYDCPKKIFKLLTPTNNEYAIGWRKNVEEYHSNNDKLKNKNTVIVFDEAIEFTNGMSFKAFKKEGKGVYAGTIQENGVFSPFGRVRFNLNDRMERNSFKLIECNEENVNRVIGV